MTHASRAHILIIEGDVELAARFTALFESVGYTVHTEFHGATALSYATRHCPDLVIVNMQLPDMNGYQVCWELRNRCEVMIMPIIVLTAVDDPADHLRGFTAGATICLPVSREDALLHTVTLLFESVAVH